MGIGRVAPTNAASSVPSAAARAIDSKDKAIQDEITSQKLEMRAISSKEDFSEAEKQQEQKAIQKKIASLNMELKQQQDKLQVSQRRELLMEELRDKEQAKSEAAEARMADASFGRKAEEADKAADTKQQEERQNTDTSTEQLAGFSGTVILRTKDGTVILKDQEDRETGLEEDKKASEDTDGEEQGFSIKDVHAMVSADASLRHADRLGGVIAASRGGITALQGEIQLDEMRRIDTQGKQAELQKLEQREQRAAAIQSAILGEAGRRASSPREDNASRIPDGKQDNVVSNPVIQAFQVSQNPEEDPAARQTFFVSLGHTKN